MISISIPAVMKCDEEGCAASAPVELALMGGGGFAFKPADSSWQISLPPGPVGLGTPIRSRCPQHKQRITPAMVSLKGKVADNG